MAAPAPRGRGKKKNMIMANGPAIGIGGAPPAAEPPPPPTKTKNQLPHTMMRKSSPPSKRTGKRRRHKQLHHEIATWWVPSKSENRDEAKPLLPPPPAGSKNDNTSSSHRRSANAFSRDGVEVSDLASLSEGENWVVCSFIEDCEPGKTETKTPPHHNANNKPIHLSIVKSRRNLYLDRGHIRGVGSKIPSEELLAEDGHDGKTKSGNIAVLCIDVDNEGHYVAVKDIRLGSAADGNPLDADSKKYDGLEFFLARLRPREQQQPSQLIRKEQLKPSNNDKAKSSEDLKRDKKEETLSVGSGSDVEGTSGYGTDDEKDDNGEFEEMNERNGVRFSGDLGPSFELDGAEADGGMLCHPVPPRETDVDKQGNLLYHHPEPLIRRQLRVLRNGDRILMRYWSPSRKKTSKKVCDEAPCMKLEYMHCQYHQERHANEPKAKSAQLVNDEKAPGETLGKPRLLSVKSADVKSYEKKRFTLNSTSAADAPTEDDAAKNTKKPPENAEADGGKRRKAGEDWSAAESAKKGHEIIQSSKQQGKGGRDKINNADEDDDAMEEYSYLTGEVMIKDQDYISAITGDEIISAITGDDMASAMAPDETEDGDYKQEYDGEDAATASAVVLGATTSPSKAPGRMSRGLKDDGRKDGDVDEKVCAPSSEVHNKDGGEGGGRKSRSDGCEANNEEKKTEFVVEAVLETNGGPEEFLTCRTSEHKSDDDEENNSEEELLSQPDNGDSPAKVGRFEVEEAESIEESDDDSGTDLSKTQPFPIPKNMANNTSMQSFSTAEEDNDDSTACPEEEEGEKSAAGDSGADKACTASLAKLDAVAETAEKEAADEHVSTQPRAHADTTTNNHKDPDVTSNNNVTGKACTATPEKLSKLPETAEKEMADANDSDETSDNQPTQKFPSMGPHGGINTNNLEGGDSAADNGVTEEACLASPGKLKKLPEADDEEEADNPDSDDPSDNEPTQKFPIMKPLGDVNTNNQDDEDDEAYHAETQNDDEVYQAETQSLVPFNSPTKLSRTEAGVGIVTTNATEKCPGKIPAKSETPSKNDKVKNSMKVNPIIPPQINSFNEANENGDQPSNPNGAEKNKFSTPQTNTLKEAEEKIDTAPATPNNVEDKFPANPEISKTDIKEVKNLMTKDDEVAAKPATAKDVHFELPLPPEKPSGAAEDEGPQKREENRPDSAKPPPAKALPEKVTERRAAPRAAYDSAVQKQRLENSAVHRTTSGAIMTGPVGGAIAFSNPRPSYPIPEKEPKQEPKKNLLITYALKSNDPNPNPLPDAAASSEETTVCQMDNTLLKKKDRGSALVEAARNEKALDERDAYADRDRDPNIPGSIEVCLNTRVGQARHSKGHRSKRKRGISFSGRRRDSNDTVRIMFTGINPTRRHKQMITDIGAQLIDSIEDALSATHVIASDGKTKLRRTPKLMICLCRTSQILSIEWLEQSAKEQRVLDGHDFLLLGDKEAEKRYNFSMKDTFEKGRKARLDRGGVLGGWSVYICPDVAGNNAPSKKELNLVVEATGAELLESLSESEVSDPQKTIVITSEPITDKQRSEKGVERVTGLGAKLLSTAWLFHTIITQHFSTSDGEEPPQHPGQHRSKRKAAKSPAGYGNRRKSSRKR